jgi:hypothetical protein
MHFKYRAGVSGLCGHIGLYEHILPWRESEDLPRIEHRREPPEAATCSDAVKVDSR